MAETTRLDLRTILRRDKLKDTDATSYKWTDDTVNEAINDAIRDYSQHFPVPKKCTVSHVDNQSLYSAPADLRDVRYLASTGGVRYTYLSPGDFEERIVLDSGYSGGIAQEDFLETRHVKYALSGFYTKWGTGISLSPVPVDDLTLYYNANHGIPTSDGEWLTIPQEDLDLIVLFTWATCLMREASADALLSRWDETPGRRDDNPVILQSSRLFTLYKQRVNERIALREEYDNHYP